MKNHYLVKMKTGKVDDNGFDNHSFFVTKKKFVNAKKVRETLGKVNVDGFPLFNMEQIEDVTACSKDLL